MQESSTYRAIIREGMAQGMAQGMARGRTATLRDVVLRLGSKRFGSPDAPVTAALNRIEDPAQLEAMTDRILEAADWDELLAVAR